MLDEELAWWACVPKRLSIQNLKLGLHINMYIVFLFAAIHKNKKLVKFNSTVLYSNCLFKTWVTLWCMGLFFL